MCNMRYDPAALLTPVHFFRPSGSRTGAGGMGCCGDWGYSVVRPLFPPVAQYQPSTIPDTYLPSNCRP
jgi:hypothetical protein